MDEDEFDPAHKLFDFMAYRVMKEALRKDFTMPFRLRFVDANEAFIQETEHAVFFEGADGGRIIERVLDGSESTGPYKFPLTCNLSDAAGRMCSCTVSNEQMRKWREVAHLDENGIIHWTFLSDTWDWMDPEQ